MRADKPGRAAKVAGRRGSFRRAGSVSSPIAEDGDLVSAAPTFRRSGRGDVEIVELPDLAELPLTRFHEIARDLRAWLAEHKPSRVVWEFSRLSGLTSATIGLMAEFHKLVAAAGGEFHVAAMPHKMMPVFKLTRLDQVFRFHKTVDDAVCACG